MKEHCAGVFRLVSLFLLASVFLMHAGTIAAGEEITVGEIEEVILLPWGVKFPARIDTGAAESSLGVCDFTVKGKRVTFTLPDRCGGPRYSLPLIGWRHIQSIKSGERRPVVGINICLGSQRIHTRVTLSDRSKMEFHLLVGRKTLKKGNVIVDVRQSRIAPPDCPDSRSP